ncbi:MAG: hypothetical protein ACNI25_12180 [Halarcobacter sp.]
MIMAVIGGTVSEISGGKFANGTVTGAFVHLFNHAMHTNESLQEYALHGKYRNVKEDMRFTANRLDSMAEKSARLGLMMSSNKFMRLVSVIPYTASTVFTGLKHLTLFSIGETNWVDFTRDVSTTIGFHKISDTAGYLSNEAMKQTQEYISP